jgi:hypothetical protein
MSEFRARQGISRVEQIMGKAVAGGDFAAWLCGGTVLFPENRPDWHEIGETVWYIPSSAGVQCFPPAEAHFRSSPELGVHRRKDSRHEKARKLNR